METITGPEWPPTPDRNPLQALELRGLELHHLGRYVLVALLLTVCFMLSAWSRIDLHSTAMELGSVQTKRDDAQAERARLELELASLVDPQWLNAAASELSLQPGVVVDVAARP